MTHPSLIPSLVDLIWRYFRVEVRGLKNLPHQGPFIVAANHSGYAGADAILLAHFLHRRCGLRPAIFAHPAFFGLLALIRRLSAHFGLHEATVEEGVRCVEQGLPLLIFPEGEDGNFKPSTRRYRLERFHTGFLRIALAAKVPVIPCVVIGAEDSHFNLGSVDLSRWFRRLKLPIPLNLFPLPAKWTIRFLSPLNLEPLSAESRDELEDAAGIARVRFQEAIDRELARRPFVYF